MKRRKEIATLVIGVLAVLVILVGQINYYPVQAKAMQENTTGGEDETASKEELRIFTNDAVSSGIQFSFQQVLHFITNVYSDLIIEVREIIVEYFNPIDYFETLFQRIISPNAP